MKSKLKSQLLDYIGKTSRARPEDLKRFLGVSSVTIHKHLNSLLEEGKVQRHGKPPLVFYTFPLAKPLPVSLDIELEEPIRNVLEERYVYISPVGDILYGLRGFKEWVVTVKQEKQFVFLAQEFVKIRREADVFFKNGYIESIEKIRNTFREVFLEEIFYQDFFSLPKFGKTKLGAFVLYAKQSQNIPLIKRIATECKPILLHIIKKNNIDGLGWIPHSIPRKIPFLKELEKELSFSQKKIDLVKAYSGELPVPQKSLSKLEERITNARNTFFLRGSSNNCKRILLIDDALGSGATMNEVAKKIKFINPKVTIFGYAIVGSFKGFEVIKEA